MLRFRADYPDFGNRGACRGVRSISNGKGRDRCNAELLEKQTARWRIFHLLARLFDYFT
jgi:hypothetical protein